MFRSWFERSKRLDFETTEDVRIRIVRNRFENVDNFKAGQGEDANPSDP